jgi:hypothetical protein
VDEVDIMEFGEITDVEGSVFEDIKLLKASPLLSADMEVLGYTFGSGDRSFAGGKAAIVGGVGWSICEDCERSMS